MKLYLERENNGLTCTTGALFVDDYFFCYTLEDVVREDGRPVSEWKIKGSTAIPRGSYVVKLTFSNRFKRVMPQLMDVPGFEGIRIHAGNTDVDTDGCILVGKGLPENKESITESRKAYDELMVKLQAATDAGEAITMEVV